MKRKFLMTVLGVLMAITLVFGLTACDKNTPDPITEPVTYTVTFDAQGHGTAPSAQTVEEGAKATDPGTLSADGWIFGGWYKEAGCTNAFDFTAAITANTTVYAKWTAEVKTPEGSEGEGNEEEEGGEESGKQPETPATYTVTFNVQGHGTAPAVQNITSGGHATDPGALTADGWTFEGWFTSADGNEKFDFTNTAIVAITTIYAHWSKVDEPVTPLPALQATRVVAFDPSDCTTEEIAGGDSRTYTVDEVYTAAAGEDKEGTKTEATADFVIYGASSTNSETGETSNIVKVVGGNNSFTYNGNTYSTTKYISLGGTAKFNASNYISLTTSGACRVVVAAKSSGASARELNFVNASDTSKIITTFAAGVKDGDISVTTCELDNAGTYLLGSKSSGVYVYYILIEYTDHEHTTSNHYGYNQNQHWLLCDTCGEIAGEPEDHVWENGYCKICGLPETNEDNFDTVQSVFDAEMAYNTYGQSKTTEAINFGKFTTASGLYFTVSNGEYYINTQGKDITVVLSGIENAISFKGNGQSSDAVTQFSLFLGTKDVTPASWATDSKDLRNYSAEGLLPGTYTIKTSKSGGVFDLTLTELLEKSNPTGITVSGGTRDFIYGDNFDLTGLNVVLNYENGRQDILSASEYTVNYDSYNKNQSGEYTVTVTYKANTDFTASYSVYVYAVDSITLGYNAIVKESTKYGNSAYANHSVQQLYFNGETYTMDGLSVTAVCSVAGTDKQNTFLLKDGFTWKVEDTNDANRKLVTVTYGNAYEEFSIYVVEKPAIAADATKVEVYVDEKVTVENIGLLGDNGYQVNTILQAMNFLEGLNLKDDIEKVINLAEGDYWEKIDVKLANVSIIGAGADKTLIEYDAFFGDKDESGFEHVTDSTQTLLVRDTADGFYIKGVTVSNYWNSQERFDERFEGADNEHRALALLIQADKVLLEDCAFLGYQDTIEMFTGRSYFKNCLIVGATDYIFGTNGTTYFEGCEIRNIYTKNSSTNGGYITAFKGYNKGEGVGTDDVVYGAIFDNCDFTCETDDEGKNLVANTALGRPWGNGAAVMIMNSRLGSHISTAAYAGGSSGTRYVSMSGLGPDTESVKFFEYNNSGAGAITESQTYNGKTTVTVLTDAAEAAKYNTLSVIFGTENGNVKYMSEWDGAHGAPLTEKTYNLYSLTEGSHNAGTEGEDCFNGDMTIYGTFRVQSNGAQINEGAKIVMNVRGEISASWYGSPYGTEKNGKITYKDGYATLEIVNASDEGSKNGIYLISIAIDYTTIPEDTAEEQPEQPEQPDEEDILDGLKLIDKSMTYTYAANVDGNSDYFRFENCDFSNGSWFTYNATSKIQVYVVEGAVISFTRSPYDNNNKIYINGEEQSAGNGEVVEYTATEKGIVTITASGTAYFKSLSIKVPVKVITESGDYYTHTVDLANSNEYVLIEGSNFYNNGGNLVIKTGDTITLKVLAGATIVVTSGYYQEGNWGLFTATEDGNALEGVNDTSKRTSTFVSANGGEIVIQSDIAQACIVTISVAY